MSLCKSYKHYLSLVLALLFSNADNLAMETFHSVSWKVHTGRFMEIIYYKIRNVFFLDSRKFHFQCTDLDFIQES